MEATEENQKGGDVQTPRPTIVSNDGYKNLCPALRANQHLGKVVASGPCHIKGLLPPTDNDMEDPEIDMERADRLDREFERITTMTRRRRGCRV